MDKKNKKWKKFETNEFCHYPSCFDKEAIKNSFYAREYTPKKGYDASETNQLIYNFKKSPDRQDKPEWQYKIKAAKQFARELHDLFSSSKRDQFIMMTIPVSKLKNTDNYDPRFDMMLDELLKINNQDHHFHKNYLIETPIVLKENVKSASHEKGSRDIDEIYSHYAWRGFNSETPDSIIIIDDVVTTGSQFMACKKMLTEKLPTIKVVGVFWSRTISEYEQADREVIKML